MTVRMPLPDNKSTEALSLKEFASSLPGSGALIEEDKKLNYAVKTGNMVFPVAVSSHNSRSSSPQSSPGRNQSQKKYVQVAFDFEAEGPGELTSTMIYNTKLYSSKRRAY